jgi:transcriptional antiterminator
LDETGTLFKERFELLILSGQASERSVAATKRAIEMVENYYGARLTEESGQSLANHLAVTLNRLLEGEKLVAAPEAVWEELRDYPEEYALSESIVAELESILGMPLSHDELGFIAVHLCKIRLEADKDRNK